MGSDTPRPLPDDASVAHSKNGHDLESGHRELEEGQEDHIDSELIQGEWHAPTRDEDQAHDDNDVFMSGVLASVKDDAAIKVQSHARVKKAKNERTVLEKERKQNQAATKVQTAARGKIAKQERASRAQEVAKQTESPRLPQARDAQNPLKRISRRDASNDEGTSDQKVRSSKKGAQSASTSARTKSVHKPGVRPGK